MGVGFEDVKPHVNKLNAQVEQQRSQRRVVQEATKEAIREVAADTKWILYSQALNELRETNSRIASQYAAEALMGLPHDTYVQKVSMFKYHQGKAEAFRAALELVEQQKEPENIIPLDKN